jgi:hypothetical protein
MMGNDKIVIIVVLLCCLRFNGVSSLPDRKTSSDDGAGTVMKDEFLYQNCRIFRALPCQGLVCSQLLRHKF